MPCEAAPTLAGCVAALLLVLTVQQGQRYAVVAVVGCVIALLLALNLLAELLARDRRDRDLALLDARVAALEATALPCCEKA